MPRSPAVFRQIVKLAEGDQHPLARVIQSWQQRDFLALDPAWRRLANGDRADNGTDAIVQRAWIERPRGHAKTSDMAVQLAWVLAFSPRRVTGLAAAADQDQAGLIRDAIVRLIKANPSLLSALVATRWHVENRETGSRLQVISSDAGSSYGALPDFVICDELCHWERPELWHSLLSAAAKQRHCVLAVLTNAGVGRGWQWDARESIRTAAAAKSPVWHFSTIQGVQAPWIDPRFLEEQQSLLPTPVYQRLWQNIWQDSDGEFVTLAEAEACRDANLVMQNRGEPGRHYIAAVDYAEKHDRTVGVVLHVETTAEGKPLVIVDRMDVVSPTPNNPTPVAWVEDWLQRTATAFGAVTFVLDEWQLLGVIQQARAFADVQRFAFAGGEGNHRLAMTLRKLILGQQLSWYPQCGQIESVDSRDDLETELAALLFKQSARGLCRIDHRRDQRSHDDRAFALGAACLTALSTTRESASFEVTPPTVDGEFAW